MKKLITLIILITIVVNQADASHHIKTKKPHYLRTHSSRRRK